MCCYYSIKVVTIFTMVSHFLSLLYTDFTKLSIKFIKETFIMKRIYLVCVVVFFILIPFIIFLADILDITQYIKITKNYDWLSFLGSIYASGITIFGVFLTLKIQRKNEKENVIEENRPEIIIDIVKEEVKNNESEKIDNGIYHPSYKNRIYLKNVGKETAKEIKCIVTIKELENKAKHSGIKIDAESEVLSTDNRAIFKYIENSTFNILALQKNEKKEISLGIIEHIIEMLAKAIIKSENIKEDMNSLEQNIIITLEYQDLFGTVYQRNFDIKFLPTVVDLVKEKVYYIINLV